MTDLAFFDEPREQSRVKATIVSKYFWAWAKVIIASQKKRPALSADRIAYIDLFAGPGRYKDGAMSTPLLVLEKAIRDPDLRKRLVMILNDKDESSTKSLEREIAHLPDIHLLKHRPKIYNEEVGDQIVKMFMEKNLVPTLFFVDPWGYKGLSLRLINTVLKDWGCDCIFFFNYNRINMGLGNEFVENHMNDLFGKQRADVLRQRLGGMNTHERELAIVEEICQALQEMGGGIRFAISFQERSRQPDHSSLDLCQQTRPWVRDHERNYGKGKLKIGARCSDFRV